MTTREKDDVETSPFCGTWSLFLSGTRYGIPGFQEPGVGLRYTFQPNFISRDHGVYCKFSNVPVPQYRVSMQNRKDSPKFTIHIYRLHKDFLYKYAGRVCTVFPCKLLMHQNPFKMRDFLHQSLSHDENGSLGGAWLAAPTVEVIKRGHVFYCPFAVAAETGGFWCHGRGWWLVNYSDVMWHHANCHIWSNWNPNFFMLSFFLSCKGVHFFNWENKYNFNSRSRRGSVGESWKKGTCIRFE